MNENRPVSSFVSRRLSAPRIRLGSTSPCGLRLRAVGLCVVLAMVTAMAGCSSRTRGNSDIRASIVRVVSQTDDQSVRGTGFFVEDSLGRHWVVTNFHVIEAGGEIIVERTIDDENGKTYTEAYPEVRVAQFDADADLAILELRNVPRAKMPALRLGEPKRDISITSWGYPASNLVSTGALGLTRKEGVVSNLIRLPVLDRVTGQVLREGAVQALVVSAELEPGFSGGPTVDGLGNVVGINLLKDEQHQGQNAAVNVEMLSRLLRGIREPSEPTADEVKQFLDRVQNEYLHQPISERKNTSEMRYVALEDRPRLRTFHRTVEFARYQTTKQGDKPSLAAQVGFQLAALPGIEFESWTDAATRQQVNDCVRRASELEGYLGKTAVTAMGEDCMTTAYRMFVWDLVSSTLRWNGRPGAYTISRIETVSDDDHLYKATVSLDGEATFPLLLSKNSGALSLRLFDLDGVAYAIQSPQAQSASDFVGTWVSTEHFRDGDSEFTRSEEVQIRDVGGGILDVQHTVRRRGVAPQGRIWVCNQSPNYDAWVRQYFRGAVKDGQLVPERVRPMEHPTECSAQYSEDMLVRFEIHRGELIMYRTEGEGWPETQRLTRSG